MCFKKQEYEKIFNESLCISENVGILFAVCELTLLIPGDLKDVTQRGRE